MYMYNNHLNNYKCFAKSFFFPKQKSTKVLTSFSGQGDMFAKHFLICPKNSKIFH